MLSGEVIVILDVETSRKSEKLFMNVEETLVIHFFIYPFFFVFIRDKYCINLFNLADCLPVAYHLFTRIDFHSIKRSR